MVTPYPFVFQDEKPIAFDAPILIVGDSMAKRVATFKTQLARKISTNLNSPIKIESLSFRGSNSHRVLHMLKRLSRLPLIVIFLSNTDENYEDLFNQKDEKKIVHNLDLHKNDYLKSLLMIFPAISKLVYTPISYKVLSSQITAPKEKRSEEDYLERMEILYKLYEATLDNFFGYLKKRASIVIPVTTPLNLKTPPKKSCYGSIDRAANPQIDQLIHLLKQEDYKSAFNLSEELVLLYPNNAKLLYYHSQVLYKLNRFSQAHHYGEMAITFDCGNQRGSPIFNAILKKMANKHNYIFFDYHRFLADESSKNYTFVDEVYPQDFYLEKLTDILAQKIQKMLKLDR